MKDLWLGLCLIGRRPWKKERKKERKKKERKTVVTGVIDPMIRRLHAESSWWHHSRGSDSLAVTQRSHTRTRAFYPTTTGCPAFFYYLSEYVILTTGWRQVFIKLSGWWFNLTTSTYMICPRLSWLLAVCGWWRLSSRTPVSFLRMFQPASEWWTRCAVIGALPFMGRKFFCAMRSDIMA